MKRAHIEMQKKHTTLVFLFLFVPVMLFASLAMLYPEFVFLMPLGLVIGLTTALLKPKIANIVLKRK